MNNESRCFCLYSYFVSYIKCTALQFYYYLTNIPLYRSRINESPMSANSATSHAMPPIDTSYKRIVAIALPVLLANLAMPLQSVIETAIVGNMNDNWRIILAMHQLYQCPRLCCLSYSARYYWRLLSEQYCYWQSPG